MLARIAGALVALSPVRSSAHSNKIGPAHHPQCHAEVEHAVARDRRRDPLTLKTAAIRSVCSSGAREALVAAFGHARVRQCC
jgi:hypothetical protein